MKKKSLIKASNSNNSNSIQDKLKAGALSEIRKKAEKGEDLQGLPYSTIFKLLTGKTINNQGAE
jgi:hypothetical protein|tara:strand:+ start:425 stop:616 length:192 start_codon:yes stop_codon:yes gene_type:complete